MSDKHVGVKLTLWMLVVVGISILMVKLHPTPKPEPLHVAALQGEWGTEASPYILSGPTPNRIEYEGGWYRLSTTSEGYTLSVYVKGNSRDATQWLLERLEEERMQQSLNFCGGVWTTFGGRL